MANHTPLPSDFYLIAMSYIKFSKELCRLANIPALDSNLINQELRAPLWGEVGEDLFG